MNNFDIKLELIVAIMEILNRRIPEKYADMTLVTLLTSKTVILNILDIISSELTEFGFDENNEPNSVGIKLETIINYLSKLARDTN